MIERLFAEIIKQNASDDAWNWIKEKSLLLNNDANATQLNFAFTAVPRKMGKKIIEITADQEKNIDALLPGFSIHEWTIDRLSRVRLLMNLNSADKDNYIRIIENPFPSKYLDEPAWNQMVLKAFFTEKNVERIIGLDQRANKRLASILFDYAHERWAAHRTVKPQLWRLVGKFIDENNFSDIQKLFKEGSQSEKKAAALALSESDFMPAKNLLNQTDNLKNAIREKTVTWNSLAKEIKIFSSN